MEIRDYQQAAAESSKLRIGGPQAAVEPMLGLASETGSILNVYKRYLRDGIDLTANREFLRKELGDLLWYAAAVATAFGLDLDDVAQANLERARDRYLTRRPINECLSELPILDAEYPEYERFPRRLVIEFIEQSKRSGQVEAVMKLVLASPNPFYENSSDIGRGKQVGFQVNHELGDPLTDNSRHADAYRFHDAIHMGFMTVLGWSPNMRSLLRLKRKSNPETDEVEDGARAIFAEEGLAAVLSRLAQRRNKFQSEANVDGEVIDVTKSAAADLEVSIMPGWVWQRAITQGFRAMHQLAENGGGYLIADLAARTLTYEKVFSSDVTPE